MAFGLGGKSHVVDSNLQDINVNNSSPHSSADKDGYGYDPEIQDEKGRKKSRIGAGEVSDDEAQLSVGQQVELEATNAIKYRTCSWQKVSILEIISSPTLSPQTLARLPLPSVLWPTYVVANALH